MTNLEEFSRAIGRLEGKTDMLSTNQEKLIISIDKLHKQLKHRNIYNSAKVIGGAFAGGFVAVIMKFAIWRT